MAIAGVNRHWEFAAMRLLNDRAKDIDVHPIERIARHAGFEHALNRVDMLRGQIIYLPAGLLCVLWRADKLRVERSSHGFRDEFRVLRSVPAFRSKKRSAKEQFSAKLFATPKVLAPFQQVIESISRTPDRRDAAIQIGLERPLGGLSRIILRKILWEPAAGSEVHMHVDQPRKNSFAGRVDRVCVQGFRIGGVSLIDIFDPTVVDQDGARLNDRAVADKDARILNEPIMPARAFALENPCLGQFLPAPNLITAEQKERQESDQHPEFGGRSQLFLLLPPEEFGRNEKRDQ